MQASSVPKSAKAATATSFYTSNQFGSKRQSKQEILKASIQLN